MPKLESFFDDGTCQDPEWVGMPEFKSQDQTSHRKIIVHFRNDEDVEKFAELMGQKITRKQPSLWYPYMPPRRTTHLLYVEDPLDGFEI
jgi:hypothetical protein